MTASVPNRHSPMTEVKKGVTNMGTFVVDQNFLQNQTIKGMFHGSVAVGCCVFV